MADIVLKPVPLHPLTILTPPLAGKPDEKTLELIRTAVERICADDVVYSVTNSPVLCPVDKRYLYVLHPHYWQKDDGTWERREGQRNPYCELPQGQKQLDKLCMAIRDLALGVKYLSDDDLKVAANDRAKHLLQVFFVDEETKMLPEVEYAQVIPGQEGSKGNSLFIIPTRFLLLVTQHLSCFDLGPELEGQMRAWFQAHVDWVQSSEAGKECAARDDNKPFWYYAPLATHLNYLDPPQGEAFARDYLNRVMDLRPTATQFFAKTLARTDPRHSSLFLLEPTFILAHLAKAEGKTLEYLHQLLQYAKTIQPGLVDVNSDSDERFLSKLALFERLLAVMRGGVLRDAPVADGEGWEGGWGEFLSISWGLLG